MNQQQQQQFVFNMGQNPQEMFLPLSPELQHQSMVLEIYNNWDYEKDVYTNVKYKQVNEVRNYEHDWLLFLQNNSIDIDSSLYVTSEDFFNKHLKVEDNETTDGTVDNADQPIPNA